MRNLKDVATPFEAGLDHSWVADPDYLPDSLAITAISGKRRMMGLKHKIHDTEAPQFHYKSIMTTEGR